MKVMSHCGGRQVVKTWRPLDARHFDLVRPTLKFSRGHGLRVLIILESIHKIFASGTPGRTLTESLGSSGCKPNGNSFAMAPRVFSHLAPLRP